MAESVPGRPAGPEQLRRANAAAVLRALRADGPGTRSELARRTGLAKATTGVIVADLERAGVVVASGGDPPSDAGRGRPGRPVALDGRRHHGLGLELNVEYVAAVVLGLDGEVVRRETRAVDPDAGADRAEAALVALAAEVLDGDARLVGATLALPGLVRADNRSVAWAPNLDTVGDALARRLDAALAAAGRPVSVRVANDANCSALAEAHRGASAGTRHSVYLTGTVGIGAGLVDGGRLVRGASGVAGEVGHLPIGDPEARCGCGRRGCWEAGVGLLAMVRETGVAERGTPVATAEAVAAAARDGSSSARAVAAGVERVGERLGDGLAILTGVLDPEVIVLGGYFVPLGDLVVPAATRALDSRLASQAQPRPEIRLGALGIGAASLGAAELALAAVFDGDLDLTDPGPARP